MIHFEQVQAKASARERQTAKRKLMLATPSSVSSESIKDGERVNLFDDDDAEIPKQSNKQALLHHFVDPARAKEADFFYRTSLGFRAIETLSFSRMLEAIKKTASTYVGPSRGKLRGDLLTRRYEKIMDSRQKKLQSVFAKGLACTIVTDGATISKRPLSNVLAYVPTHGPELITFDDATEHMQDGGKKDARYHAALLIDAIEEIGPEHVAQICTDNASVMVAAWHELERLYPKIYFTGCLAHKGNTLVKKLCGIIDVSELIDKCKSIVHHFGEKHVNASLITKYTRKHLGTELGFIIPSDTRFGLYLLMLHRIGLMKPAIQAAVLDVNFSENAAIQETVLSTAFWKSLYELVQYLMPLLRFIRLCDSDKECMGLFYSRVCAIENHFAEKLRELESMPGVADKIFALFKDESKDWVNDMHKTMHVLNPEFSNDFSRADMNLAVRNFVNKIFYVSSGNFATNPIICRPRG